MKDLVSFTGFICCLPTIISLLLLFYLAWMCAWKGRRLDIFVKSKKNTQFCRKRRIEELSFISLRIHISFCLYLTDYFVSCISMVYCHITSQQARIGRKQFFHDSSILNRQSFEIITNFVFSRYQVLSNQNPSRLFFLVSFIPHPPIAFLSPIYQIWKVRRLLSVAMQIDLSISCCSKFIPWLFSFSPLWRCLWICDAKGSYLWSLQHPNANGFLPFCMVRLLGHSWTRSCWKCSFPLLSQVSLMMASSCP